MVDKNGISSGSNPRISLKNWVTYFLEFYKGPLRGFCVKTSKTEVLQMPSAIEVNLSQNFSL